jgi:DNA-binding MarR family transcriptional regulator
MKRQRPKRDERKATKGARPEAAGTLALGQLNHHLGYFVRRLQIWIFQDFIRTLAPVKVRPAQYSVLLMVEANPGRSQAAIGQTLGIERARLARMLHELERRKWVARHANGSDARSHSLYLTADGEKALTKIKKLAGQHENHLRAFLGKKLHRQSLDGLRDCC